MGDDVLGYIVPVLICDELGGTRMDFFHELSPLGLGALLKHSLNYSATVIVRCKGVNLAMESGHHEWNTHPGNHRNDFLDDVISILIFDNPHNVRLQLLDDFFLLLNQHMFKSLLLR
jgi:hypothetical protein